MGLTLTTADGTEKRRYMLKREPRTMTAAVIILLFIFATLAVLVQITKGHLNITISYAAVILACLSNLLFYENKPRFWLMQVALICTVCADWFLLVRGSGYEIGMCFFNVTQLAYAARTYLDGTPKVRRVQLFVRLGFWVASVAAVLAVLGDRADMLSIISVFYFVNLALNIIFAFINIRRGILFPLGLVFFILCDVFVGFSNMGGYLEIPVGSFAYWLAHPGFNAAWLFYVPSQGLLGTSLLPEWLAVAESNT